MIQCVVCSLGTNADLEYVIVSVTPTSNTPIFSVDLSTGAISTVVELDRETQDEYDITIQVFPNDLVPASQQQKESCTIPNTI